MRPSRRVQAAAVLFLLVIAASLLFAPAPAAGARALAGLVTVGLLWLPLRAVVFLSGPAAVRGLSWAADGKWSIVEANGIRRDVILHSSSGALGPWLMLTWTSGPGLRVRRWHALIDAATVSPFTFRTLRGRLKLERTGRGTPPNPPIPGSTDRLRPSF